MTTTIHVRYSTEQYTRIAQTAARVGLTVSAWLRFVSLSAADKLTNRKLAEPRAILTDAEKVDAARLGFSENDYINDMKYVDGINKLKKLRPAT